MRDVPSSGLNADSTKDDLWNLLLPSPLWKHENGFPKREGRVPVAHLVIDKLPAKRNIYTHEERGGCGGDCFVISKPQWSAEKFLEFFNTCV